MSGLPPTWRLRLDGATRRIDGGRVLVGGTPFRLLRVNAAGAAAIARLDAGEPIGQGAGVQALARRLLDAGMAHPAPTTATLTAADVTAVVPTYPGPADLATTLGSLGPVAACIVVDDAAPEPGIAEMADSHAAQCVRHDANRGPAAARNTGWRLATTDVIAFVDPNCSPDPGWLEVLLPHFDDPQVVAVAPRITTRMEASLHPTVAAYESARPSLDRGSQPATVRPRSRVPFVPTTALLVRRSALEAVGGFDETLRFGEDVDLVWRLAEAGGTVRYEPSVAVAHGSRKTAGEWLRQRYGYGTSAAELRQRHGAAVAPLSVSPWTAAAWTFVGAGFPAAGAGIAVGTIALLAPKLRELDHPAREAIRLGGLGHLYAGRTIADAIRRPWWPFALAGAFVSRRARRVALAAIVLPPLAEWWQQRPPLDPARWTAMRLIDDITYGAGVWKGCLDTRSAAALAPDLRDWPGRRPAVCGPVGRRR